MNTLGYQRRIEIPPLTTWLKVVLIANWLAIAYTVLQGILVMAEVSEMSREYGEDLSDFGRIVSGFLFLYAAIWGFVVYQLGKYNNTSRVIMIVLLFIALFIAFVALSFLHIAMSAMQLYVLLLHEETKNAFEFVANPMLAHRQR